MSPDKKELVWELQWFSKKTHSLAGELLLEHSRVDAARLKSACGLAPEARLLGGLDVRTPEAVAYLEGASGLRFDLETFDYQIEAVRRS